MKRFSFLSIFRLKLWTLSRLLLVERPQPFALFSTATIGLFLVGGGGLATGPGLVANLGFEVLLMDSFVLLVTSINLKKRGVFTIVTKCSQYE